jgi:hypothetical protein
MATWHSAVRAPLAALVSTGSEYCRHATAATWSLTGLTATWGNTDPSPGVFPLMLVTERAFDKPLENGQSDQWPPASAELSAARAARPEPTTMITATATLASLVRLVLQRIAIPFRSLDRARIEVR